MWSTTKEERIAIDTREKEIEAEAKRLEDERKAEVEGAANSGSAQVQEGTQEGDKDVGS